LNEYVLVENKSDDTKYNFSKEYDAYLISVLSTTCKFCLGDFSAKEGRENIFKPVVGN